MAPRANAIVETSRTDVVDFDGLYNAVFFDLVLDMIVKDTAMLPPLKREVSDWGAENLF